MIQQRWKDSAPERQARKQQYRREGKKAAEGLQALQTALLDQGSEAALNFCSAMSNAGPDPSSFASVRSSARSGAGTSGSSSGGGSGGGWGRGRRGVRVGVGVGVGRPGRTQSYFLTAVRLRFLSFSHSLTITFTRRSALMS